MVTKAKSPVELSPYEQTAVRDFLARIHGAFTEQTQEVMLFGSRARGESTDDSDIDILLIVAQETWQFKDEICNIISDISLKYDVLLDVRVIGASRWRYMSEIHSGLYQNISRDAIPLAI